MLALYLSAGTGVSQLPRHVARVVSAPTEQRALRSNLRAGEEPVESDESIIIRWGGVAWN